MTIESGNSQEQPKLEQIEDDKFPVCPLCGCEMIHNFDYFVENDLLYTASDGYDGISQIEWFECPGCGYED